MKEKTPARPRPIFPFSMKRLPVSSMATAMVSALSLAVPVALPVALSAHEAHAQVYTMQPNVATSLGNAAGAALSGNYNGGSTMFYGNGASLYRNNQVYGGPDYTAQFFGAANPNNPQSLNSQETQEQRARADAKREEITDPSVIEAQKELEKAKQDRKAMEDAEKKKANPVKKDKESDTGKKKQESMFLDPGTPLSVSGTAHAFDGISMKVGTTLVILHGLSAPGNGQMCNAMGVQYACGDKARENLSEMVDGKPLSCTGWGNEGICINQLDGSNINNAVLMQHIAVPK